jgi:hypothetical protein
MRAATLIAAPDQGRIVVRAPVWLEIVFFSRAVTTSDDDARTRLRISAQSVIAG